MKDTEKKIIVTVPTIYMHGGLIQGVEGFPPRMKFDIIDYDTEGMDEADLCRCEAGDSEHYHSKRITDKNGKE